LPGHNEHARILDGRCPSRVRAPWSFRLYPEAGEGGGLPGPLSRNAGSATRRGGLPAARPTRRIACLTSNGSALYSGFLSRSRRSCISSSLASSSTARRLRLRGARAPAARRGSALLAPGVAARLLWPRRPRAAPAPPLKPELELGACDPDEVGRGQPQQGWPLRLPAHLALERLPRASLGGADLLPGVLLDPGRRQAQPLAPAEPAAEGADRGQLHERVLLLPREQLEHVPDQRRQAQRHSLSSDG
jgi:hypothetical protein